jgi:hypothetical protein
LKVSTWDLNFQLLLQFRDRERQLRVPLHHIEVGQKSGGWIRMNREQKNRGTLDTEKERRLNELGSFGMPKKESGLP